MRSDVLIIGSGAAGLLTALHCAEKHLRVVLITKGTIEESNTAWAQGGVAASLDLEEDSATAHVADTLAAGAGLCDPQAAAIVAAEAPRRVEELHALGVAFTLSATGALALTREAAHSHPRTVYADDATGKAIETTLAHKALHHPRVTVLERTAAVSLLMRDGRCCGATAVLDGTQTPIEARLATVLATGGVGQVFARTTNPPGATGDGLLLAASAGAELADLEFVQFHPTALAVPGAPALLVSEAARGEGGILVNTEGRRFCFDTDPRGELAPRDVVARAIFREMQRTQADVWLDLRPIGSPEFLRTRFPNIAAACARFGVDISTMPIPVGPAAHYHMGGIRTDLHGRTSLSRLYAVGECACTGLHGANRLAGNSLAECLVFAGRAADDIAGQTALPPGVGGASDTAADGPVADDTRRSDARTLQAPRLDDLPRLRTRMWEAASVERSARELQALRDELDSWPVEQAEISRASLERRALLNAARYIAAAALVREESRGAHFRVDFPVPNDAQWRARIVWVKDRYRLERLTVAVAS